MSTEELARLRRDFELHASRYPDLTLSVFVEMRGQQRPATSVRRQNHKIMLWQYLGNATVAEGIKVPDDLQTDRFGLVNAELSAFALIEGPETELFCRMASRAGSLIPDQARLTLVTEIMANVVDKGLPGKPVFAANADPLSAWLNLVLTCLTMFQPERFNRERLPVDPFTASLTAFDHMLNRVGTVPQSHPGPPSGPLLGKRFAVSLSFPGEHRPFVAQVAAALRARSVDVFYDQYFEPELAKPNLDLLLQRIYSDNSELVVVFLCHEYDKKEWCGLEWRAVRDMIKKKHSQAVMLFRFDEAEVAGLLSIDGYIDLRNRTPADSVDAIIRRLTARVPVACDQESRPD